MSPQDSPAVRTEHTGTGDPANSSSVSGISSTPTNPATHDAGGYAIEHEVGSAETMGVDPHSPLVSETTTPASSSENLQDTHTTTGDMTGTIRTDSRWSAALELEIVEVQGPRDAATVERILRLHRREYRMCYEEEAHGRPELTGRILLRFQIEGSGSVQSVIIDEDSLGSETVAACLSQRLQHLLFPPMGEERSTQVTVRFLFSQGQ